MKPAERFQRFHDTLAMCLISLLIIAGLNAGGCMSGQAHSQKTLAGIQYAADAAMKLWGSYVAHEQRRLDALPEPERVAGHGRLLEHRLAVDHARTQFSVAWSLAFNAARFDNAQPAGPQLVELLTNLETTINAFAK